MCVRVCARVRGREGVRVRLRVGVCVCVCVWVCVRSGQFRGQKGLGTLEKSLEMPYYLYALSAKKNYLPHFQNERYINSLKINKK